VGYRDHHDEFKTFLVNKRDLSEAKNIVDFIYSQNAAGGGGDGAEAVMDGLSCSIN
jgi:hypothetical protein